MQGVEHQKGGGAGRKGVGRWEGGGAELIVQLVRPPPSLARVNVIDTHALLTADVAAPVEDAVAFLLPLLSPGVVAPAAAQQVAALYPMRRHVADAVSRPEGARLRIGLAEVGRALVVDQVALSGVLEEVVLDPQRLHPAAGLAVLLHHHLGGTVVLVLQVVPQHAEVGLRPPARLDLAAPGQAVAFAAQVHVVQDGLRNRRDSAFSKSSKHSKIKPIFQTTFPKENSTSIERRAARSTLVTLGSKLCKVCPVRLFRPSGAEQVDDSDFTAS